MKTNAGHFSGMIPGSSSSLQNDATNQLASHVNRANHFYSVHWTFASMSVFSEHMLPSFHTGPPFCATFISNAAPHTSPIHD